MATEVHVTDYGVSLAIGNTANEVMLASMADLPVLTPDSNLLLSSTDHEESHHPVLLRHSYNSAILLEEACLALKGKASNSGLTLLLLPSESDPQYPEIKASLKSMIGAPEVKAVPPHQLQKHLEPALTSLQQGDIEQLTVFGLDSMAGTAVMSDWLEQGKLRTQLNPDGRAVGEGFGWFTLSRKEPDEQQPAIRWRSGKCISEPTERGNGSREHHGLALSLQPLLQHIGKEPDTWVYSRRQTPLDDLEALMAFQYHWGNTKQKQLEQLCPARKTGDLGAAALPVAVALACERLAFERYKKSSALVSDSHPDGRHFSLLLSKDV